MMCGTHTGKRSEGSMWYATSQKKKAHPIRNIFEIINRLTSKFNNSKHAQSEFDRIVLAKFDKRLDLKPFVANRFLGAIKSLERTLKLWWCLEDLYQTHFGHEFPLKEMRIDIEQIGGLLHKLKELQEHSQNNDIPVSCTRSCQCFT